MSEDEASRWLDRLGATLDAAEVVELLNVTHEELGSLVRSGEVLALPAEGTGRFPAWQFETDDRPSSVRPITARLVATFRDAVPALSTYTIASWAKTPQPELNDWTPADWIEAGMNPGAVTLAAQRSAHLEKL